MEKGFKIVTKENTEIRFKYYTKNAPLTSKSFKRILPLAKKFKHAMVSGKEIFIDDLSPVDVIQENASVFVEPGEVVLGPMKPKRTKTVNCLGVYYGEGKGLDAANIFAKVLDEDFEKLKLLGEEIRNHGVKELEFKICDIV